MKKILSIFMSLMLLLSIVPVVNADELEPPVDDPIIPEYTVRYVPGGTGTQMTLYVTDASITVRPRVTAGNLRVYDSGTIVSETVQVCADIMGFSSYVYTINQIHAEVLNVSFYQSGPSIYASFRIRVWAGSYTNNTITNYINVLIF